MVVGPTAVGKTALAIELAKQFTTEIISADSRQCYKELKIGVARPSEKELQAVPHHFIATQSIEEEVTAADFERYALGKTKELFQNHDVVVMVGGTGLYMKAFSEGLDEIPTIEPGIRKNIISHYQQKGLDWLKNEVKLEDPAFFEVGEVENPQRLMRALEVKQSTGRSILHFQGGKKRQRDFNIMKIGLQLLKEQLHENINARVDKMMEQGLLEEVRLLVPFKQLNALQTVGYKELFDYLDDKMTLEEAIDLIKLNTRRYAKRQMTWFKKDKEINWFDNPSFKEILSYAKKKIREN